MMFRRAATFTAMVGYAFVPVVSGQRKRKLTRTLQRKQGASSTFHGHGKNPVPARDFSYAKEQHLVDKANRDPLSTLASRSQESNRLFHTDGQEIKIDAKSTDFFLFVVC